ncbi:MAG: MaoC family dehydratase [Hyphomonadaceae bacterium]|nr:MaoC family dehydratase [Hyphomonadaceae bacterium]
MRKLTQDDVGKQIGTSEWIRFSQDEIDTFGRVTRDIDPFHMDADWARQNSPFKTTIAFGFQTLSMLTYFIHEILDWPGGIEKSPDDAMALNYGFERVRFVEPVPVDQPFRCHMTLLGIEERNPGETLGTYRCTVEVQGVDRPALVADWKGLFVSDAAKARISRDLSDI